MTAFCCIYGFAINGALLTAISTMEKRFELSSTISGVMLASYDIGFLITTIPLEAITRDMNRGRVLGIRDPRTAWFENFRFFLVLGPTMVQVRESLLGIMSLLIGFASFLYSVPHFATSGNEF